MNYIRMSVEGNHLKISEDCISTGGSINYDRCIFTFDSAWDGFTKTAVFSINGENNYRVPLENNACVIPSVCIEREGILQIGVFGVSDDDVIITTNSVAHHVIEGIDSAGEWVEEDSSLVIATIEELKRKVDEYAQALSKRVSDELDNLKTDSGRKDGMSLKSDWYLPTEFTDTNAVAPFKVNGVDYERYLDFRLNALVQDFPEYVAKQDLGTDASGECTIYAYSFTPPHYEKTIFIASTLHGSDKGTLLALSHFLDCLCRDWKNDKTLSALHENVKLAVIPIVNPYAVPTNSTYNKNGVNLAYNFPYIWETCTRYKKGDAAADQKETQTVISFLESLKNDKLCAVLELHTSNITYAGRSIFYSRYHANCATALADIVNNFNHELSSSDQTEEAVLAPSHNAYLIDYAADTYGVNACQLIWTTNLYGGAFTNYCITKCTEFIGNVAMALAENSRFIPKRKPQPFIKHLSWRRSSEDDVFTVTSTASLEKMPISAYKLKLDAPYNIMLNGYVELELSEACTVKINPVLYQVKSTELDFAARKEAAQFMHEVTLPVGTHIVPISSVLQAYYSSFNFTNDCKYCEEMFFTLMLGASVSGKVKVNSFAVTLNAEPSDIAKPVEVLSPIGLCSDYSADDIPTQKVVYPLGLFSKYDEDFNN